MEHLRVVRSGAVEIVHDGRILDLLGEGELFGHASMLSGLPTGFEARAAEDTLCYRIGADVARELLTAPAGLRFVARSLLEAGADIAAAELEPAPDPAHQPVSALIRGAPVICAPDTPIREAAQSMTAAPTTSVIVDVGDGSLGILTDHDLRTRVVAAGLSVDAPVSAAMSAPAYTCRPDRLGGEVLLEMLDRGFRHFPVVSGAGEVLGVVTDLDIVAAQTRSSFFLRQRIARARSVHDLVAAAGDLRPSVIAMHDARVAAANIMAVYAVVVDALTRRLLELIVAETGGSAAPFAWLSLGSQARRETAPSADVDSAIAWFGGTEEPEVRTNLHEIGKKVVSGLEMCGVAPGQPWRVGVELALRALRRVLAASGAQLDLGSDSGEGPDPRLGPGRQSARVGRAYGHASLRYLPSRSTQPCAPTPARPVRSLTPPPDWVPPRPRRRARR